MGVRSRLFELDNNLPTPFSKSQLNLLRKLFEAALIYNQRSRSFDLAAVFHSTLFDAIISLPLQHFACTPCVTISWHPRRHTTLCHSLEDLAALAPGPKVVLASMGSLETGFSRLLLEEWTKQPGNLIIFPERGQVRFPQEL